MNPQPKPVKVVRAPRPLKRSTIKRRPRSVDKPKSRTSKRRRSRLRFKREANELWSKWVKRKGRCEFIGVGGHRMCRGPLQAMHGFPKGAYPAVRYAAWNGFAGCAAIHVYYTHRAPEWDAYLRRIWGHEDYERRLVQAMTVTKHDLALVVDTYRAALSGMEIPCV